MNTQPVLEMRHIGKTFGSVKALYRVDLRVWAGEVHALMGENGAGKSTLMKILSGAYTADAGGAFVIDGQPVRIATPEDARRLGIAVIYQELSLAANLTVAENMMLGREEGRRGIIQRKPMAARCQVILTRLGADFMPETRVADLSAAQRQQVEIARALCADARILVMDEPTTTLSSRETEFLFALITQLRREGLAIIYISHRMEEVYALADRCSVLRDGRYIGTLEKAQISAPALIKMMVGRSLGEFYRAAEKPAPPTAQRVLTVTGLTDGRRLRPCSLTLRAGEVLGLAGLVGSGRTELARLIFAADKPAAGTLDLAGKTLTLRHPADALNEGIVYLTEDRKGLGLFLDMSIEDNINMAVLGRDALPGGLRRFARSTERAVQALRDLRIKAPSRATTVGGLSGGNQQKVLLARLLALSPRVLILDEPTRGVDIGAKFEIYKLIGQLTTQGVAILLISSELTEIVGLSDRVMVMREGQQVALFDRQPITQEAIIAKATSREVEEGVVSVSGYGEQHNLQEKAYE